MMRHLACLALTLLVACAPSGARDAPVHVTVQTRGGVSMIDIAPAAGIHLNAAVAPAYEFSGRVIRFSGPLAPADSLYFASSAHAVCPARGKLTGVLQASVCAVGERVCRSVRLPMQIYCP
jgi:hypothetical protein